MHIRPRCYEWLPLSTQQLRLRNLVRIQGFNIECTRSDSLTYYTLHHTEHSNALYRSESLPARRQHQKWAEISCDEMLKSNLNCVCVKVWEQFQSNEMLTTPQERLSIPNEAAATEQCRQPPDKLLFIWGVYFSGLIASNQIVEPVHCLPNSLVFQLHSDQFVAPDHFRVEALRQQLALHYNKQYSASLPQAAAPNADEYSINSPKVSRSSSPVSFAADCGPNTNCDLLAMSKVRYYDLKCTRRDVRHSYHLRILLELQKLQRICMQRSAESLDMSSQIERHCLRCITADQLSPSKRGSPQFVAAPIQHQSMGRTLSLLLSAQQQHRQYAPHTLLHMQQLQRQIETIRCKQRLLETESKTYAQRISHLRLRLETLVEERQQLRHALQLRHDRLLEERNQLEESTRDVQALLQIKRRLAQSVRRRMTSLCMELREIYPITDPCGIPFQRMDAYLNNAPRYGGAAQETNITPVALSASLGYIAHLVQMISVIFNRPLRNPIQHEGSRTRIVDLIQDLSNTMREYPLYSRSIILPKTVKYAIYLLNQNIVQLCYDITGIRRDMRTTIENILSFFTALSNTQQQSSTDFSDTYSAVDNASSISNLTPLAALLPSSIPFPIADRKLPEQRICRSAGSYSDCCDDFKEINEYSYSNSDSNLATRKFAK